MGPESRPSAQESPAPPTASVPFSSVVRRVNSISKANEISGYAGEPVLDSSGELSGSLAEHGEIPQQGIEALAVGVQLLRPALPAGAGRARGADPVPAGRGPPSLRDTGPTTRGSPGPGAGRAFARPDGGRGNTAVFGGSGYWNFASIPEAKAGSGAAMTSRSTSPCTCRTPWTATRRSPTTAT